MCTTTSFIPEYRDNQLKAYSEVWVTHEHSEVMCKCSWLRKVLADTKHKRNAWESESLDVYESLDMCETMRVTVNANNVGESKHN